MGLLDAVMRDDDGIPALVRAGMAQTATQPAATTQAPRTTQGDTAKLNAALDAAYANLQKMKAEAAKQVDTTQDGRFQRQQANRNVANLNIDETALMREAVQSAGFDPSIVPANATLGMWNTLTKEYSNTNGNPLRTLAMTGLENKEGVLDTAVYALQNPNATPDQINKFGQDYANSHQGGGLLRQVLGNDIMSALPAIGSIVGSYLGPIGSAVGAGAGNMLNGANIGDAIKAGGIAYIGSNLISGAEDAMGVGGGMSPIDANNIDIGDAANFGAGDAFANTFNGFNLDAFPSIPLDFNYSNEGRNFTQNQLPNEFTPKNFDIPQLDTLGPSNIPDLQSIGDGGGLLSSGGMDATPITGNPATGGMDATPITGNPATSTGVSNAANGANSGLGSGAMQVSPVVGSGLLATGSTLGDIASSVGNGVGAVVDAVGGVGNAGAIVGGLLGAAAGKDTTTTSSRDPWGPAQPYLLENLKQNAALQKQYMDNPFSDQQKAAYQNIFNDTNKMREAMPAYQNWASNAMNSGYQRQPTQGVPGFQTGRPDWLKGLLGG